LSNFQSTLNNIWEENVTTEAVIEYMKKCSKLCVIRETNKND